MLPTPDTSHVSFDTIYEPAEDSYLFLDTLSSASESKWLSERFKKSTSTSSDSSNSVPLVVEAGTGSGVVLAFAAAQSEHIFGRQDILTLGIDVNRNACIATRETVSAAIKTVQQDTKLNTVHISSITSDLCTALRPGSVDVLLFNPPYVPTEELPRLPTESENDSTKSKSMSRSAKFESDSYFLSLTYAGGADGMETTNRLLEAIPGVLSDRGVAYVLLCKQNRPDEVKERIRAWGGWNAESVGSSGMQAGWEKLVIVRIWRQEAS
ncbi:S-adenosylmethionine-dependent methyltransferase [Penicillium ochrochloron]|jgi:release factor glutamine methyltransferase